MGNKTKCGSKDEWGTPRDLFHDLHREFKFTLDPCGWAEYPLDPTMKTLDIRNGENGLAFDWTGHRVYCNPPYSNGCLTRWVQKCFAEWIRAEVIVLLMPPNVDSQYFHEYVYKKAELRFIRGRLSFIDRETKRKLTGNPQGSMLAIFRGSHADPQVRFTQEME